MDYKNREDFIWVYYRNEADRDKIADIFNVSTSVIDYWREKHDIPTNNNRKLHRTFVREVYELVGCEYSVLGYYDGANNKIDFKHNKCGYVWKPRPNDFLNGDTRCPDCYGNERKTTEEFKNEVSDLVDDEYIVLGEYNSYNTKILIKHNISDCGNEWEITPSNFFLGRRCPECMLKKNTQSRTKNKEIFKKQFKEVFGDKYQLLSEYKKGKLKVLVKCNKCNNIWRARAQHLINGHGCPSCVVSKGEEKIKRMLEAKNINYKKEYSFFDCISPRGYKLRFDFGVFEDGKLKFLIEFNGKQHFEYVDFFHDDFNDYKYRKKCDKIKETYCLSNNIPLIKINYWDKNNIEEVLNYYLENLEYYENNQQYSLF